MYNIKILKISYLYYFNIDFIAKLNINLQILVIHNEHLQITICLYCLLIQFKCIIKDDVLSVHLTFNKQHFSIS